MKLVYYSDKPNFGDELSPLLFNALLPSGFLDDDEHELLMGIGSILWDYLPAAPLKHVLGSGYGGYTDPPNVHEDGWNIVFVRGPHTASKLRLPAEKAICDTALLLRLTQLPDGEPDVGVAFMPHCASRDRGYWAEVCQLAGITFIDPRGAPAQIIKRIRGASFLIAEAMHGAIVADALRVPWIAAKPLHKINRMKWHDWADSLAINLRWSSLFPSSMMEAYHASVPSAEPWRAKKTRENPRYELINNMLVRVAALRLSQIARRDPQLSDERRLDAAVSRAAAATDGFIRARGGGGLRSNVPIFAQGPFGRKAAPVPTDRA